MGALDYPDRWADKGRRQAGRNVVPDGARGQPAEVAPIYVFLTSQESSYVNGEVFGVTGSCRCRSADEQAVRFLSPR
jgi:NAD(P)-dependent dehydrogenase (short-subunit alcohol dehydrogenase family)